MRSDTEIAAEYRVACLSQGLPEDCPVEMFVRHHRGNAGATAAMEMNNNVVARLKPLLQEAVACDGGHHKQWYLEQIARALDLDLVLPEHDPGVAP